MNATGMSHGYLELVIGPMFSGKTSKLLDLYKQYQYCNLSVIVINHSSDNRYSETMLSTHDKQMIPCIQTDSLKTIWESMRSSFESADVILINEGQFFDDLYEIVYNMLDYRKKVYVSGLDGDFQRKKFGQILDLIPLCDKVTKIASLCGICKNGQAGIFSKRITQEAEQTLIGSDNYVPVCRKCYSI